MSSSSDDESAQLQDTLRQICATLGPEDGLRYILNNNMLPSNLSEDGLRHILNNNHLPPNNPSGLLPVIYSPGVQQNNLPPSNLSDLVPVIHSNVQNIYPGQVNYYYGDHGRMMGNMSVAMAPPSSASSSSYAAYAYANNPALTLEENEEAHEEAQLQMLYAPSPNPDNLEPLSYNNVDNNNNNGVMDDLDLFLNSTLFIMEDDPNNEPPSCLLIESDTTFLDPLHNFLRTECIEIFVATQSHIDAPGRGSKPSCVGQLGLRCIHCKDMARKELARQAICYPSRRDTIFEGFRNYQRVHLKICPLIPQVIMDEYNKLSKNAARVSKQVLKVYYAEAASELGIVDSLTHKGLVYDKSRVNTSGVPSQQLQTVIEAAASGSRTTLSSTSLDNTNRSKLKMRKFEHVCSEATRKVLLAARKEPTVLVAPQDFPTVSDEHYLLFHQFGPIIGIPPPPRSRKSSKQQDVVCPKKVHSHDISYRCGLCCKHCARLSSEGDVPNQGVYFPSDVQTLSDSSFSQAAIHHVMNCSNVPIEIKNSLDELKSLAVEYGVSTKRGSKQALCKKVWGRMENYVLLNDQGGELKSA